MTLTEAATELRTNVVVIDVVHLRPAPPEAWREFEHEGLPYRVCFTKMTVSDLTVYMLSMTQRNAVPNARGMLLPAEEEAEEIAKVFFPNGYMPVTDEGDLLQASRKYIACSYDALFQQKTGNSISGVTPL